MKLAWSHGVRKLEVQSDSLCAIQILQKTTDEDHQHAGMIYVFSTICCSEMGSVSQTYLQRGQFFGILYCG
ncbi:hypothetical protein LINPERHAP2_LOCUS43570 [Linum perenne]